MSMAAIAAPEAVGTPPTGLPTMEGERGESPDVKGSVPVTKRETEPVEILT